MKKTPRILLMSLPAVLEEGDTYLDDGPSFHLGLAYLAAVIPHQALDVAILDSYVEDRWNQRLEVESGWLQWLLVLSG